MVDEFLPGLKANPDQTLSDLSSKLPPPFIHSLNPINKEWTFRLLTFTKTMFFVMLCTCMEHHAQSQSVSDHLRLTMSVNMLRLSPMLNLNRE